jgi:hypothetical protein
LHAGSGCSLTTRKLRALASLRLAWPSLVTVLIRI